MKQKAIRLIDLGLGVWLVSNDLKSNPKSTIGFYNYSTERFNYHNYDFGNVNTFSNDISEKIKYMLITEQLDFYHILCQEKVPYRLGVKISSWILKRYPEKYNDILSGSGVQIAILTQSKIEWVLKGFVS